MDLETEGRVLNKAALIYDYVQPFVTFGQELKINSAVSVILGEELENSSNILDIGCGTGLMTSEIAGQNSSWIVTGIDASFSMIKYAEKKRSSENCIFQQALGENLPFDESTVDAAVSALFFHHINKNLKKKTLAEIKRILKPGGKVIIADMGIPYTALGKITSYLAWKLLRQPEIRENSVGMMTELIKQEGFINYRETGRYSGYITIMEAEKKTDEETA